MFQQGLCPGLTHGQKFGISYKAETDISHEPEPTNHQEVSLVQSHSVMVISNPKPEISSENDGSSDIQKPSPANPEGTYSRNDKKVQTFSGEKYKGE